MPGVEGEASVGSGGRTGSVLKQQGAGVLNTFVRSRGIPDGGATSPGPVEIRRFDAGVCGSGTVFRHRVGAIDDVPR